MLDLFGNDTREPIGRPAALAIQLDAFDAAAERYAIESGLPLSQARANLMGHASAVCDGGCAAPASNVRGLFARDVADAHAERTGHRVRIVPA